MSICILQDKNRHSINYIHKDVYILKWKARRLHWTVSSKKILPSFRKTETYFVTCWCSCTTKSKEVFFLGRTCKCHEQFFTFTLGASVLIEQHLVRSEKVRGASHTVPDPKDKWCQAKGFSVGVGKEDSFHGRPPEQSKKKTQVLKLLSKPSFQRMNMF